MPLFPVLQARGSIVNFMLVLGVHEILVGVDPPPGHHLYRRACLFLYHGRLRHAQPGFCESETLNMGFAQWFDSTTDYYIGWRNKKHDRLSNFPVKKVFIPIIVKMRELRKTSINQVDRTKWTFILLGFSSERQTDIDRIFNLMIGFPESFCFSVSRYPEAHKQNPKLLKSLEQYYPSR